MNRARYVQKIAIGTQRRNGRIAVVVPDGHRAWHPRDVSAGDVRRRSTRWKEPGEDWIDELGRRVVDDPVREPDGRPHPADRSGVRHRHQLDVQLLDVGRGDRGDGAQLRGRQYPLVGLRRNLQIASHIGLVTGLHLVHQQVGQLGTADHLRVERHLRAHRSCVRKNHVRNRRFHRLELASHSQLDVSDLVVVVHRIQRTCQVVAQRTRDERREHEGEPDRISEVGELELPDVLKPLVPQEGEDLRSILLGEVGVDRYVPGSAGCSPRRPPGVEPIERAELREEGARVKCGGGSCHHGVGERSRATEHCPYDRLDGIQLELRLECSPLGGELGSVLVHRRSADVLDQDLPISRTDLRHPSAGVGRLEPLIEGCSWRAELRHRLVGQHRHRLPAADSAQRPQGLGTECGTDGRLRSRREIGQPQRLQPLTGPLRCDIQASTCDLRVCRIELLKQEPAGREDCLETRAADLGAARRHDSEIPSPTAEKAPDPSKVWVRGATVPPRHPGGSEGDLPLHAEEEGDHLGADTLGCLPLWAHRLVLPEGDLGGQPRSSDATDEPRRPTRSWARSMAPSVLLESERGSQRLEGSRHRRIGGSDDRLEGGLGRLVDGLRRRDGDRLVPQGDRDLHGHPANLHEAADVHQTLHLSKCSGYPRQLGEYIVGAHRRERVQIVDLQIGERRPECHGGGVGDPKRDPLDPPQPHVGQGSDGGGVRPRKARVEVPQGLDRARAPGRIFRRGRAGCDQRVCFGHQRVHGVGVSSGKPEIVAHQAFQC